MRTSFTLIELIISIVVISIAVLAVPGIYSTIVKNSEFSLQQEAILSSSTDILNILTFAWDENLAEEGKWVIDVKNGDDELNRISSTIPRRVGHFPYEKRRKFPDFALFASAIQKDSNDTSNDDIDDFDGENHQYSIVDTTNEDFVINIENRVKIRYIEDNATYKNSDILFSYNVNSNLKNFNETTNIKMIEISTYNLDKNEHIFTLRAFASNIGEEELQYRIFN